MVEKTLWKDKFSAFHTINLTWREMHLNFLILTLKFNQVQSKETNQFWFHIKCNGINMTVLDIIINKTMRPIHCLENQIFFQSKRKPIQFKITIRKMIENKLYDNLNLFKRKMSKNKQNLIKQRNQNKNKLLKNKSQRLLFSKNQMMLRSKS